FDRDEILRLLRLESTLVHRRWFVFYLFVPSLVKFLFFVVSGNFFDTHSFGFVLVCVLTDYIILLLFEWLVREFEPHFVPNRWLFSWHIFSPTQRLLLPLKYNATIY